jgi:hypothetical protein
VNKYLLDGANPALYAMGRMVMPLFGFVLMTNLARSGALVAGVHLRVALGLLFLQMAGTLTPLALFPALTFTRFPFAPTMEGQYILKNLVLISAAIVIGATMRGGKLVAQPSTRACCRRNPACRCKAATVEP